MCVFCPTKQANKTTLELKGIGGLLSFSAKNPVKLQLATACVQPDRCELVINVCLCGGSHVHVCGSRSAMHVKLSQLLLQSCDSLRKVRREPTKKKQVHSWIVIIESVVVSWSNILIL